MIERKGETKMSMTEKEIALKAMQAALTELKQHNSNCMYARESAAEKELKQAIHTLELI
jgi:hypothetical protein